jgi:hypothetical protein
MKLEKKNQDSPDERGLQTIVLIHLYKYSFLVVLFLKNYKQWKKKEMRHYLSGSCSFSHCNRSWGWRRKQRDVMA